jgi:hypothetical protein
MRVRPSAHAEAAALRWEESVAREGAPAQRVPVRRAAGPTPSAMAEGAAIRWLERRADDADAASRRAA